jgi:UDP-GlcNAc:undecaprenyl-phosphate/decaprenyl-phosphate GlcNAc-1-phosphate transferase
MIAAGWAFGLTLLLMPFVLTGLRKLDSLDHPNERSSHDVPTLRGGGIGPWVACILVVSLLPAIPGRVRLAFLLVGIGLGFLGLAEDLRGVPAGRRFLAQLTVAAASAVVLLPMLESMAWSPLLVPLLVLWVTAYVNAFNFMDGINGISAAQCVIAGAGFAVMAWQTGHTQLAVVAGVLAGAALGFLPFNFPNARAFLGDVGSYFLGGWLGLLAVLALVLGLPPEAAVAPLVIYLADTGTTLAKRVLRGEAWREPHRTHVYQRLTQLGWSHAKTTAWLSAAIVGCTALGTISIDASAPTRAGTVAGMTSIALLYLGSPTLFRRFRSRSLASN